MLFTGTYEHTIDAKQRIALPAEVRKRLRPDRDGEGFYVTIIDSHGPTLVLYTERDFERIADQLNDSERSPGEVLEYEEIMYSSARPVELDKQGRIRLPEQLLREVDLGRDVVLIGVKDHMQIRDRQRWTDHKKRTLAERPDLLMNPRRVMRSGDQGQTP